MALMPPNRRASWGERVRAAFWRPFQARQLVLREGDRLRSFHLSPRFQLILSTLGIGVAVWAVMATFALVRDNARLRDAVAEAERHRIAYHELMDEVSAQHGKVQSMTRDLDYYRAYLLALVDQTRDAQQQLTQIAGLSPLAESERARAAGAELALRGQLDEMARDLVGLNERNDMVQLDLAAMRSRLALSDDERERFAAARAAQERRITRLEKDLTANHARVAELDRTLAARQLVIDQLHAARRQAALERDAANDRATMALRRLETREREHQDALAQLHQRTQASILLVENVIASTGLDLSKLSGSPLAIGPRQPRGGPFVPWRGEALVPTPQDRDRGTPLDRNLARLEQLRQLLRALPVSTPLRELQIQSGFGFRRDPFNGRAALHEGIDFGAPTGTPAFATAHGRVTIAGWKAAYGRLVEIEHGFGLRTRYGHLSRIDVEEGDMVTQGQTIGAVGSTGRSTGSHLHYEVLVEGKPQNPAPFLKVNGYVLKD